MENGACRKRISHAATRLGKEKLAEGRSPWDRTDDNRNTNVSYFWSTIVEEASVTGRLSSNFFVCIPDMVSNSRAGNKKRHKGAKKNMKWSEMIFAHILPNGSTAVT